MINSSPASYVKIFIWESNPNDLSSSTDYGHVAIETCLDSSKPETTYISFWNHTHEGKCLHPLHFHQTFEEDNAQELGKVARSYVLTSLSVGKINRAFNTFKENPNNWGALGFGILGRAYARNCYGVAMFLLEKGGIFEVSSAMADSKLNFILKNVFCSLGLLYSALNFSLSYSFDYYVGAFFKIDKSLDYKISFFKKAEEYSARAWSLVHSVAECALEINETIQKNPGKYQLAFDHHVGQALDVCRTFPEIKSQIDVSKVQNCYQEVEKYIEVAAKISRQLSFVAIISASCIFIFNFMHNRFIASRFSPRQIRVLLERTILTDQGTLQDTRQ